MSRSIFTVFVFVAAAVGGCADSAPAGGPDAGAQPDVYQPDTSAQDELRAAVSRDCMTMMDAACGRFFDCLWPQWGPEKQAEQLWSTREECVAYLQDTCDDFGGWAADSIPSMDYDPTALDACLAKFDGECRTVDEEGLLFFGALTSDTCPEFLSGRLYQGGNCGSPGQCAYPYAQCLEGRCTGPLGPDEWMRSCSSSDLKHCSAETCLTFHPNVQKVSGVCTTFCSSHLDCGPSSSCVHIGPGADDNVCVARCDDDADCANGLVCVHVTDDFQKACAVQACANDSGTCACDPSCDAACSINGCGELCGCLNPSDLCTEVGDPTSCTPCVPECDGKDCGPDGCGGTCGTCDAPETCGGGGVAGQCACEPQCDGKECGADGCGGQCGYCSGGDSCGGAGVPGECGCIPFCDGKDCGPDLCGGSCGECDAPETCGGGGVPLKCGCTPDCDGKECGDDGCGGSCGECAAPASCGGAGAPGQCG